MSRDTGAGDAVVAVRGGSAGSAPEGYSQDFQLTKRLQRLFKADEWQTLEVIANALALGLGFTSLKAQEGDAEGPLYYSTLGLVYGLAAVMLARIFRLSRVNQQKLTDLLVELNIQSEDANKKFNTGARAWAINVFTLLRLLSSVGGGYLLHVASSVDTNAAPFFQLGAGAVYTLFEFLTNTAIGRLRLGRQMLATQEILGCDDDVLEKLRAGHYEQGMTDARVQGKTAFGVGGFAGITQLVAMSLALLNVNGTKDYEMAVFALGAALFALAASFKGIAFRAEESVHADMALALTSSGRPRSGSGSSLSTADGSATDTSDSDDDEDDGAGVGFMSPAIRVSLPGGLTMTAYSDVQTHVTTRLGFGGRVSTSVGAMASLDDSILFAVIYLATAAISRLGVASSYSVLAVTAALMGVWATQQHKAEVNDDLHLRVRYKIPASMFLDQLKSGPGALDAVTRCFDRCDRGPSTDDERRSFAPGKNI